MDRRKITVLLLSLLLLALCACSRAGGGQAPKSPGRGRPFEMKDVLWTVEESILEGERVLTLEYTNNSPYPIISFEITFTEREDLTPEEREDFFSSIRKEHAYYWGPLDEDNEEEFEKIKAEPLKIKAETERMARPGETVRNVPCCYFDGWFEVKKKTQLEKTEADFASVRYVRDGIIYTGNYDFHSGKLTTEEKTEPAYTWTDGPLADKLPRPDTEVVTKDYCSEESWFSFEAHGFSREAFAAYVAACREMGYTSVFSDRDDYFRADSAEGCSVSLSYDEDDCMMDATVYAPHG